MDIVGKKKRSQMMAGIKSSNTQIELLLRHELHKKGLRYRTNVQKLSGTPDIVFRRHRAVIEVMGCFWHGHKGCRIFKLPKTRTEFWRSKIAENRKRDAKNLRTLKANGWRTLLVWECCFKGRHRLNHDDLIDFVYNWVVSKAKPSRIRGGHLPAHLRLPLKVKTTKLNG